MSACDTVVLGGDGFEAHVSQNQRVRAGDPLLTFDLDALAARVKSLMTPVIVVDGGGFEVVRREQQRSVRIGDVLMELRSLAQEIRKSLRVPYEHGIHARPAALLAASLRGFTADVRAQAHGRTANARSAVAWMELGVQRGEEITLIASGADAGAAIAALESAFGNPLPVPADQPHAATDNRQLRAVIASRGIAIGPAALINASAPLRSEAGDGIAGGHVMPSVVEAPGGARGAPPSRPGPSTTLGMTNHESAELERARAIVRAHLEQLHASTSGIAREVLEAHLSFIDDPELLQARSRRSRAARAPATRGARRSSRARSALRAVGDPRVAERADDLRDLAGQVLRASPAKHRSSTRRPARSSSDRSCCRRSSSRFRRDASPASAPRRADRPRTSHCSHRR
jgi:phosphotransferase system HPr (HPr) family protein